MTRDPVCDAEVNDDTPWFTSYRGDTYYFNSHECKEEFDRSPAHFAQRAIADRGEDTANAYPTSGTEYDSVDGDGTS